MYVVQQSEGRQNVAIDRDTTRDNGDASLFDAFDLPDLTLPASDGPLNGSTLDSVAESAEAVLDDHDTGLYEVVADSDGTRVTRLAYGRHLRVLLVEADLDRAGAFTRAADESVLDVRVEHVTDVDATLSRLERASHSLLRRPLPDVIVVSLPTTDAHDLLEVLKLDERFDAMPILVLNETADPAAERRAFSLGATAHLVTPRRDYERVALVHALPDFIPRARAAHAHLESHRQ
jgi:CheY-like chemotaxis protein